VAAIALGIRASLGLIFVVAGAAKLTAPNRFARAIGAYGLLPRRAIPVLARALPLLEIATGTLLLARPAAGLAALAAAALLAGFAVAVALNLARGRRFDCGCAGLSGSRTISWTLVARNVLLAGAATFVAVVELAPHPREPSGSNEVLPVTITAWTATVLVTVLSETRRLARHLGRVSGGRR
jgi:uncharacterized membrane protein YphA (DoxX/SURF4 family)